MKINSLKLSNVLSFEYYENIDNATELKIDHGMNIIIGENGAGKSTALEAINFFLKKVIFCQCKYNPTNYSHLQGSHRKNTLSIDSDKTYIDHFRLDPNWDTEDYNQTMSLELSLDKIDKDNIETIINNFSALNRLSGEFCQEALGSLDHVQGNEKVKIEVSLNKTDNSFTIRPDATTPFIYLQNYWLYQELININNQKSVNKIPPLNEPFVMLEAFRNYSSFSSTTSLTNRSATDQQRQIRSNDYSRSFNSQGDGEPRIFSIVKLRIAKEHYDLFETNLNQEECERRANDQEFLRNINKKLDLVNLECKIRLKDRSKWEYTFEFYDTKRNKILGDINALSAGQKSIIHLIFEAYGRGSTNGGLVIVDEPEIHLHYQFQNEYLQIIEEINKEQKSQYILVTHSEALINHKTIGFVKRFSLDENRHSVVKHPDITNAQMWLVKILDNTRSAHALFGQKIVLVEGETDRYLYTEVLRLLHAELIQNISIFDVGGKGSKGQWRLFFESFGIAVYEICDFDIAPEKLYGDRAQTLKIKQPGERERFIADHPGWEQDIERHYLNGVCILKYGELEDYTGTEKKLEEVINFCNTTKLAEFIENQNDPKARDLVTIIDCIVQ